MSLSKIPFLRWLPKTISGWLLFIFIAILLWLVEKAYQVLPQDIVRLTEEIFAYNYIITTYLAPFAVVFLGVLLLSSIAVYIFFLLDPIKEELPVDALFRQNNVRQIVDIIRGNLYAPKNAQKNGIRHYIKLLKTYLTSVEVPSTADTSLRLALTGPWGSGKTWVAKEVARILMEDKKLPINIFRVKSSISRNHNQTVSQITQHILYKGSPLFLKPFILALGVINSIAELSFGAGPLSLKIGSSSLNSATDILKTFARNMGQPLLVIIDDIDRMKPEEIGPFFVAFEEISHLPNTLFLLVYEPEAVRTSIRKHQPAWENTDVFLLKMVDLTIPLTPTNEEIDWDFFKDKAIKLNYPDEAVKMLEGIKEELPSGNPRIMERLALHLAQLNPAMRAPKEGQLSLYEIMTYQRGLGAVDGEFYLTIARFKLLQMLDSDLAESLRTIAIEHISDEDVKSKKLLSKAEVEPYASLKSKLCQNLKGATILAFPNMVERLTANLSQNKPKELIDLLTPPSRTRREAWEKEHFPNLQQSLESFAPLQTAYEIATGQAADAFLSKQNKFFNERAQELLPLLEIAWQHIKHDSDVEKNFGNFLGTLSRYVHFRKNPADKELRQQEENTIARIIAAQPHLWTFVENQSAAFADTDQAIKERTKRLRTSLGKALEGSQKDIGEKMLEILKSQGAAALLDNQVYYRILEDPVGPFWGKDSPLWKEELSEALLHQIDRIDYRLATNKRPWNINVDVAKRLWSFYTSQEWQYRTQYHLGELAANLVYNHPSLKKFVTKPEWVIGDTYDKQFEAIFKKLNQA